MALHSMDNQPRNKPDLLRCHGSTANAVDHHGALAAVSEVNVAEHDPQRPRFCERKLDQLMGPRLERLLLTLLGCLGAGLLAQSCSIILVWLCTYVCRGCVIFARLVPLRFVPLGWCSCWAIPK